MNSPQRLYFIKVEFEANGTRYVYSSPWKLRIGQVALVNVYGNIKAVKVVARSKRNAYPGPVKMIAGLGYSLEELQQPYQNEPIENPIMSFIKGIL